MSNKTKRESALVQSVLALDNYLSELERVGAKINSTDMMSDIDFEFIQKLMNRFAECGLGVSREVASLSDHLQEARTRAETVARGVSAQADLYKQRSNEHSEKLERLRQLGEKVRELSAGMSDRTKLSAADIPAVEAKLGVLIDELQDFQKSARDARMRTLEKTAQSLAQSLDAVRKKLRG
jgi:chromosome segregation ATPase